MAPTRPPGLVYDDGEVRQQHPSMRLRIAHALVGDERPVIGWTHNGLVPSRRRKQLTPRPSHSPMDQIILTMPSRYPSDPFDVNHQLARRTDGQVDHRQDVKIMGIGGWQAAQGSDQAALLSLNGRPWTFPNQCVMRGERCSDPPHLRRVRPSIAHAATCSRASATDSSTGHAGTV